MTGDDSLSGWLEGSVHCEVTSLDVFALCGETAPLLLPSIREPWVPSTCSGLEW